MQNPERQGQGTKSVPAPVPHAFYQKFQVQEEINIMNLLRHQKLLQLAAAFENPKETIMVME